MRCALLHRSRNSDVADGAAAALNAAQHLSAPLHPHRPLQDGVLRQQQRPGSEGSCACCGQAHGKVRTVAAAAREVIGAAHLALLLVQGKSEEDRRQGQGKLRWGRWHGYAQPGHIGRTCR